MAQMSTFLCSERLRCAAAMFHFGAVSIYQKTAERQMHQTGDFVTGVASFQQGK
jgi:hypothetical protein